VARGPKVARQASKSGPRPLKELKEKYIKNAKIDSFTGYSPTDIIITICYCKLYYFDICK